MGKQGDCRDVDCQEALAHLQDYLKRELGDDTAGEVQRHLDRCRHCFSRARFEENFLQMLEQHARKGGCPEALRRRILDLIRSETALG
jgi:anti-sigma factor (TIGR02949 family)